MKYSKIMLSFWITMPLAIILRTLQLIYTVEAQTGFFKPEFLSMGSLILILIFLSALIVAIFSFTSHRTPEKMPQNNIFMSVISFIFGISVLLEILSEKYLISTPLWQVSLLRLTGFATALFFIVFAVTRYLEIKLHNLLTILPVLYLTIRIIHDFTAISTLVVVSDNLILMAAYALCLLTFFQFAKFYNGLTTDWDCRKLLAYGLSSVIFCFSQSIPHIFIKLFTDKVFLQTSYQANINLLVMGVFILIFLLSHFSYKNSCDAKHKTFLTKIYNRYKGIS